MADFSGLALNSMIQMQNQDLNPSSKALKTRKKSIDIPEGANLKVSSKLLKILKDNQDEFNKENIEQSDFNQIDFDAPSNYKQTLYSIVSKHNFLPSSKVHLSSIT